MSGSALLTVTVHMSDMIVMHQPHNSQTRGILHDPSITIVQLTLEYLNHACNVA